MTRPGPGKFEGNESLEIAEFLSQWSPDDAIGDVDSFGWYGLVTGLQTTFDEIRSEARKLGIENLFDERGTIVEQLKPAYIVLEDSQGFFMYRGFDTDDEAMKVWKNIVHQYNRWESGLDQ